MTDRCPDTRDSLHRLFLREENALRCDACGQSLTDEQVRDILERRKSPIRMRVGRAFLAFVMRPGWAPQPA